LRTLFCEGPVKLFALLRQGPVKLFALLRERSVQLLTLGFMCFLGITTGCSAPEMLRR
jgi:hypothetical protein